MPNYDWSRFTKRIAVNTTREVIYKAWTTTKGIESWFLKSSQFTRDGKRLLQDEQVLPEDNYIWRWYGYNDDVMEKGKILEANGQDYLQFTFGNQANLPITVAVSIKIEDGEQVVELTQENIATDEASIVNYHLGCMEGWTFYLANLKSILEGGIDLRNKNENLKRVINS